MAAAARRMSAEPRRGPLDGAGDGGLCFLVLLALRERRARPKACPFALFRHMRTSSGSPGGTVGTNGGGGGGADGNGEEDGTNCGGGGGADGNGEEDAGFLDLGEIARYPALIDP